MKINGADNYERTTLEGRRKAIGKATEGNLLKRRKRGAEVHWYEESSGEQRISIYFRTIREIMRQGEKFVANHVEDYKGRSGELQESIYKGQK